MSPMLRSLCVATLVLAASAPPAWSQSDRADSLRAVATGRDLPGRLRPGDVIKLRVWREPDLTGEFPIDERGSVTFPMLGEVRVTEQLPADLRAQLVAGYTKFLSHSSIDVTFLRRVQVMGAVREPGLYPVDGTMTIGDALALAGGPTPDGNAKRMELIRGGVTVSRTLSRGSSVADARLQSGDQLYVPQRPWVSRNSGLLVSAGLGLVSASIWALVNR